MQYKQEKQAYLTYAQSRYRWGKLTDSEPSRFIEEINGEYLEYLTPEENNYRYKPMIDNDIFGDIEYEKCGVDIFYEKTEFIRYFRFTYSLLFINMNIQLL